MIWILYNILFPVGFLLLLPKFIIRMCRRGGYAADFMQRLSWYRPTLRDRLKTGGWVWIQAVSVGEIFVAFRFMEVLRARHPQVRFVLSTNTSTGHAIGRKKLDARDVLLYFPLDIPFIMRRVLNLLRPFCVVLVENEMWPNLVRGAQRRGIPVVLVNGRISSHSFGGYQRLSLFTRDLLPRITLFCAQSEADAERLRVLGAPEDRVQVMGSAKYDVIQSDPGGERQAGLLLRAAGLMPDVPLLLGASTWPGEEKVLLEVFKELRGSLGPLNLCLAPRHMERRDEVLRVIQEAGLTCTRRSDLPENAPESPRDMLLLDSTGELKNFYVHADVIFVGKSLTQHGGQNPIEPAFYGKAVITGPHMENFPGIIEDFCDAKALIQVRDSAELFEALKGLLADAELRRSTGERAGRLVREKAGVVEATVLLMERAGISFEQDVGS
ncbi:MAG: 3-deoxy-D-manno-octulosonic acid transferase [Kiritimatiellae bacterium]|nr:3-deoxy-D-manno-octulosonic acid transferase [Kiritimatiellia bacterium]